MKDVSITEFGRECTSLINNLPEEGLLITKDGQPIALVSPIRPASKGELVTGALIVAKGTPGPLCPGDETPCDLIFD